MSRRTSAAAAFCRAAPRLSAAPSAPSRLQPSRSVHRPQLATFAATSLTAEPRWRLLLLSDGHTKPLLSVLASAPLSLRLHAAFGAPPPLLPPGERFADDRAVRRVASLLLPDGTPLLTASSCWSARAYALLQAGHENLSLPQLFRLRRVSCSRAVLAVHFGLAATAAPLLCISPRQHTWARDYVFRRRGATFLHVHEVFLPAATRVLGPMPQPTTVASLLSPQ